MLFTMAGAELDGWYERSRGAGPEAVVGGRAGMSGAG